MKFKTSLLLILLAFSFCKKDKKSEDPVDQTPAPTAGTLKVSFKAVVDGENWLAGNTYTTQYGDSYTVSMFKYYISNVVLTKDDGSKYYEVESYHLMDHTGSSKTQFTMANIPPGIYKSITYMIGVDSARNVSGAQDGDLAPSKGMFWTWAGYNMLKFEGNSPQAGSSGKTLTFHIGGYSGNNNVLKTRTILFGQDLSIANTKTPELKLKTNINELFKTPTTYDFATTYDITQEGILSNGFAENYKDMIGFDVIIP